VAQFFSGSPHVRSYRQTNNGQIRHGNPRQRGMIREQPGRITSDGSQRFQVVLTLSLSPHRLTQNDQDQPLHSSTSSENACFLRSMSPPPFFLGTIASNFWCLLRRQRPNKLVMTPSYQILHGDQSR